MAPPQVASNLLETLMAVASDLGQHQESIFESIHLERTIDAATLGERIAESLGSTEDTSVEIKDDLLGLPRRAVIEPGGVAASGTDYRLVGAIGQGGTGIVYQAHQRAVNREVAIKVLRNHLRGDRAARMRFLTEARTVGALDHPNVIALHELALDDNGHPFYSMKRIDGTAWSEVLGQKTLEENLSILLGVADAIRYAHSRGIIHRDIKPANVMLGRYGEVMVADWGLALPHPLGNDPGAGNSIGGTPAYMAPEIALGKLEEIGPRTDVYLLGATLFHLLTGFPPHDGESLIACVRNAAANHIRQSDVQNELMDIALVAMSTEIRARHQSVEAFQQSIRDYQQHQESSALLRGALRHADAEADTPTYERMSLAISLAREALEIWPDNMRAKKTLRSLRVKFAELALAQNDLDLALSLLEAAGESQSELAGKIRARRAQRSARIRGEERYTTLFANSPDAVLVTRVHDGSIVDANDSFLSMFGHQRERLVGLRVADIQLWECPERRLDFIGQIRETGRVDNFETTLQDSQQKKIPVLISARRAKLDGEDLVVAHTRDITLRRAAEVELRRSRSRLRQVQQLANLGTWEVNLKTGETLWSEETRRILGLPPNAPTPNLREFLSNVHPADREKTEAAIRDAIEHGAAYQLRIRHQLPAGGYITTISRGQPILNEQGEVVELFGSLLDVTDRCQFEEQLKQRISSLRSLLDFTGRPLFALDRNGKLVAAASQVLVHIDRDSCCMDREIFFEAASGMEWSELEVGTELVGRFIENGRPLGEEVRVRIAPSDGLLRCEVVCS